MKKQLLITGMVLALTCASSLAGTSYWSSNATGFWDTTTFNWSSDPTGTPTTTFTAGDAVIFSSSAVTASITANLTASYSVASLTKNGTNTITITGTATGRTLTLLDNTATVNDGTLSISTNAKLSTTGDFVKAGNGILSLSSACTFGGNVSITGGYLNYVLNRLPTSSIVTIASGAALRMSGAAGNVFTQAGLSGAGSVEGYGTAAAYGLTLDRASGTSDFSGVIQNGTATALAITKNGTFTQTLSGANTYTGATTVNAGTLLINGSTSNSSAVTVNAGGTIGGNGTIGGSLTLNGGNLNPGNSPGLLTVGSLVLSSGNTTLEINNTTRGTTYDAIDVAAGGAVQFGGALTFNFGNGGAFADATTFNLFAFNTTSSGNFSGITSTGYASYSGLTWTQSGDVWSASAGNGQILNFSELDGSLNVIPEPATWALLAFSLTTIMVFRRRRMN